MTPLCLALGLSPPPPALASASAILPRHLLHGKLSPHWLIATSATTAQPGHPLHREPWNTSAYTHFSLNSPAGVFCIENQGNHPICTHFGFSYPSMCKCCRKPRDYNSLHQLQLWCPTLWTPMWRPMRLLSLLHFSGSFPVRTASVWGAIGLYQPTPISTLAIPPGQLHHRVPHNPHPIRAKALASQESHKTRKVNVGNDHRQDHFFKFREITVQLNL